MDAYKDTANQCNNHSDSDGPSKQDLIERLKIKIGQKEDVGHRYQQKHDPSFIYWSRKHFGNYAGLFAAAEKNYKDFKKVEKTSKEEDLEMLIGIIVKYRRANLDQESMLSRNSKLTNRLSVKYGGYYSALDAAMEALLERGDEKTAKRADPEYWKEFRKKKKKENHQKKVDRGIDKIIEISADMCYDGSFVSQLPEGTVINFPEPGLKGLELFQALKKTGRWLLPTELARSEGCTPENIAQTRYRYADGAIRYTSGSRTFYLYHDSAAGKHEKKHFNEEGEVREIAGKLDVNRGKIRSLMTNLNIPKRYDENGRLVLTDGEKARINAVVAREKEIMSNISRRIDPDKQYPISELDILGVPVAYFLRGMRSGSVGFSIVPGPYADTTMRVVSGKTILDYFEDDYNPSLLSQAIQLMTHFRPHLYTTNDLAQKLSINRRTVAFRLESILAENKNACFRIRKDEKRSKIIICETVVPYVKDYSARHELRLIDVLKRDLKKVEEEEAKCLEEKLGEFIIEGRVPRKKQRDAFRAYRKIRDYLGEEAFIGGREITIAREDIVALLNFMQTHSYNTLELDTRLTHEDIFARIDNLNLVERLSERRSQAEEAIFLSNEGIRWDALKKMNLNHDMWKIYGIYPDQIEGIAGEALLSAIRYFNPDAGFTFATYAYKCVMRHVRSRLLVRKRIAQTSIDATRSEDDDRKGIDFLEDEDALEHIKHTADLTDIKENVMKALEALDEREKIVIIRRFGLDGNQPLTLRETGKLLSKTGSWAGQVEVKALQKLRESGMADKLYELM